jgi:hypothetical protein
LQQSLEQGTLPVSYGECVLSLGIDRIQNVRNLASLPVVNILERVEPVFERVENLGPLPIGYVWDFVVYEKIPAIGQFDLC